MYHNVLNLSTKNVILQRTEHEIIIKILKNDETQFYKKIIYNTLWLLEKTSN